MTTDTVSEVVDVAALQAQVEAFLPKIAAASTDMVQLGKVLAEYNALVEKVARAQSKASKGMGTDAVMALRTAAFSALGTNLPAIPELTALVNALPKMKAITMTITRLNGSAPAYSFNSTGGLRTGAQGKTRTQRMWVGKGLPDDGGRIGDLVNAFGKKHGQTVPFKEMTSPNKEALIAKIVAGEKLTLKVATAA